MIILIMEITVIVIKLIGIIMLIMIVITIVAVTVIAKGPHRRAVGHHGPDPLLCAGHLIL